MKKRPMTLIAGIIGTAMLGLWVGIMLIGITAILDLMTSLNGEATGSALISMVAFLEIGLGVAALVLNAVSISGFAATPEKYAKKRGAIITAIVFNMILALILLISLFQGFSIINALVMIAIVAASVLYIVDMCLEGKRVEAAKAQAEPSEPAAPSAPADPSTNA